MSFINPLILYLLPAVLIPLIIYFLINRKKVILPFAAFEWMKKALKKRRKKTRIDNLLKLIAKILLVLALVIFAARPSFKFAGAKKILVVVDTSVSMGATVDGGASRLESARETVRRLRSVRKDASIVLASFDEELRIISGDLTDLTANSALEAVKPGAGSASFAALLEALEQYPDLPEYDTICIVSDFQRTTLNDKDLLNSLLRKIGTDRFMFLPVDTGTAFANVSIDEFIIPPEGFYPGRANPVTVRLTNHGTENIENLVLTLSIDGIKKDLALVNLPPESSVEAELSLMLPAGAKASEILLEIPPDALEADNTLRIIAEPRAKWNVLSVAPMSHADEGVSADFYIRSALETFAGGDFLRVHSVTIAETNTLDLANYDLVVTTGIDFQPNGEFETQLNAYLENGGSLISFVSPHMQNCWDGLNIPATIQAYDSTVPQDGNGIANMTLKPDADAVNGSYLDFMNASKLPLATMNFRQAGGITLQTQGGEMAQSRLKLAGLDAPTVIRMKKGRGTVILAAFLPVPGCTSIVLNPNFIQFMRRMTNDAVGRSSGFYSVCGMERKAIELPQGVMPVPDERFILKNRKGDEICEGTVRRTADGASVLDVETSFPEGAFLSVYRAGEENPVFSMAFNPARGDSSLIPVPEEFFADAVADGLVYRDPSVDTAGHGDHEYFRIALILLVLAVLLDIYAHFIRRRDA